MKCQCLIVAWFRLRDCRDGSENGGAAPEDVSTGSGRTLGRVENRIKDLISPPPPPSLHPSPANTQTLSLECVCPPPPPPPPSCRDTCHSGGGDGGGGGGGGFWGAGFANLCACNVLKVHGRG